MSRPYGEIIRAIVKILETNGPLTASQIHSILPNPDNHPIDYILSYLTRVIKYKIFSRIPRHHDRHNNWRTNPYVYSLHPHYEFKLDRPPKQTIEKRKPKPKPMINSVFTLSKPVRVRI